MSTFHIVICNERLIQRFGVDRLLLQLGAGLRDLGHRISFVCLRCDEKAVSGVSPTRYAPSTFFTVMSVILSGSYGLHAQL